MMPGSDIEDASTAAERLREAVEELTFEPAAGQRCRLTVSIGIAWTTEDTKTPEALLRAADLALYSAKRSGRNRVDVAPYPDKVT